jgi:DNA-binding XRE family transcriptional regulator
MVPTKRMSLVLGVRGLIARERKCADVDERAEMAICKAFGARVRALRKLSGMSQEELAAIADLDRSYIGGVERGERNVSLLNIFKIAKALKAKPEALFK